jgi:Omp85 superfamily domain
MTRIGCAVVVALSIFVGASTTSAQIPRTHGQPNDTVTVVPGARYATGSLRRFVLGDHYRDLWTTPIRVRVLDLRTFAGGLVPVRSHVGSQTTSLRFDGADGRTYQFRSVFKTPAAGLRADLQNTVIADVIQDGASASHPAGSLVVSPLLEAAGVLHAPPSLVVMPDDPSLGEYFDDFAGVLGWIEERPDEGDDEGRGGFGVALRVISPSRLYERVNESPRDQVDIDAFLVARLVDILIGDRDRHRDNWRWALLDSTGPVRRWEPISRDHDEAFVKLDGLALGFAKRHYPQLTSFDDDYDNTLNLNWHSREIDRRFFAGVDRARWDSAVAWLQGRLTDDVIRDAVHALPPAMYAVGGARLEHDLIARRNAMPAEIARYYALLSRQVDIHATDDAEIADVVRVDDRFVDITIRGEDFAGPWFHRRFDSHDTHEIRLDMWGGADRVVVRGDGAASITLRVVGGRGRDILIDSSRAGGVHLYDVGDETRVVDDRRSELDRRPWPEWVGSDSVRYPPRDWGTWMRGLPLLGAGPDYGALIGFGLQRTTYGFRKQPYSTDLILRAGVVTGEGWGTLDLATIFRRENSNVRSEIDIHASGIERLRFYGFGNGTTADEADAFYKARLDRIGIETRLVLPLTTDIEFALGPLARWTNSHDVAPSFFSTLADTLYGAGSFLEIGARGSLQIDTRDRSVASTRGVWFDLASEVFPAIGDVTSTYGNVAAEARLFLTPGSSDYVPTLALRASAERVFGDFPFHEAAYLGGRSLLRGWSTERFAGDALVSGSVELRQPIAHVDLILPADFGIFALFDAGRVWFGDTSSDDDWHTGAGGGIWFAFLDRASTFSLSLASGRERTVFYAGIGFGF